MKCDFCGERFRFRKSPVRAMRAFYSIFMCPHCLCVLRPGNLQIALLNIFTAFLFAAIVTVFLEFGTPLRNIAVPAALFGVAISFWIASLFCEKTVLLAVVDLEEDFPELELESQAEPSLTSKDR